MSPTETKSLPSTPAGQPVKALSVADELTAGKALAQVRSETAEAIVKNRDLLRLLIDRGYATDEERAEAEKLYPTPVRKPKAAPAPVEPAKA